MKVFVSVFSVAVLLNSAVAQEAHKELPSTRTVLFVCEHGAARSTIASAYFNKLAQHMKLKYQSVFRGTDPDSAITAATKRGLAEDGFDTEDLKPQLVVQRDIEGALQIVTFDCTLPNPDSLSTPLQRWDGIPPISKNYQVARDEIVKRVRALIAELANRESH
jgi:protein-tyrosine-phosphatase